MAYLDLAPLRRREIELAGKYLKVALHREDLEQFLMAWVWNLPRSSDTTFAVIEAARRMGQIRLTKPRPTPSSKRPEAREPPGRRIPWASGWACHGGFGTV